MALINLTYGTICTPKWHNPIFGSYYHMSGGKGCSLHGT